MNLKPLGDRVIVKQDEAEETTASGLFLATEAKEKPQSGTALGLFLRLRREEQTRSGGLLSLVLLDDNAITQRFQIHNVAFLSSDVCTNPFVACSLFNHSAVVTASTHR